MAFKKFRKSKYRASRGEYITINKNGLFSVTCDAYDNMLKGINHVHLYFDEEIKLVGIEPLKDKTPDCFNIRAVERGKVKGRSISISAVSFLKHHKINYTAGKKTYIPKWDSDEKKLIVLDLNNPV